MRAQSPVTCLDGNIGCSSPGELSPVPFLDEAPLLSTVDRDPTCAQTGNTEVGQLYSADRCGKRG